MQKRNENFQRQHIYTKKKIHNVADCQQIEIGGKAEAGQYIINAITFILIKVTRETFRKPRRHNNINTRRKKRNKKMGPMFCKIQQTIICQIFILKDKW